MIFVFEIIGIISFAIVGAMAGIRKKMDLFGVIIIAGTNSMGGGIIRDVILGIVPPVAFKYPVYLIVATTVALIVFIPVVRKRIHTDQWLLNLMDAIGLAAFAIVGSRAGADTGNSFLMVFLGTVTCVGGGVLKDLFCGEIPSVFVKHFYATPAIIGSTLYVVLRSANDTAAAITGAAVIIILRMLAAHYRWNMPRA